MRRLLILLLVCLLPLQSSHAAALGWVISDDDHHELHWVEHEEGVSHHHLDDGRVQHDDSDASAQHMSDHGLCHVTAAMLTPPSMLLLARGVSAYPAPRPLVGPPDPDLEDPIRPPQARLSRLAI